MQSAIFSHLSIIITFFILEQHASAFFLLIVNSFAKTSYFFTDICLLSNDIYDYHYVSQGKVTIPNVDDAEEFELTDVSYSVNCFVQFLLRT